MRNLFYGAAALLIGVTLWQAYGHEDAALKVNREAAERCGVSQEVYDAHGLYALNKMGDAQEHHDPKAESYWLRQTIECPPGGNADHAGVEAALGNSLE